MAALVDQKEAARLLGVSEDDLNLMISRNEIFGYRDGANWKFKMPELERVADERGIQLGGESPEVGGSGIDADLEELRPVEEDEVTEEDAESILVSEEELGQSAIGSASTIIGREQVDPDESDVKSKSLASPSEGASDVLMANPGADLLGDSNTGSGKGSDVELVAGGDGGSDLELVAGGSDIAFGGSDIDLSSGDTGKLSAEDIGDGDDVLEMELADDAEATGIGSSGGSDDDLDIGGSLSLDDDAELESEPLSLDAGDALSLDDDDDAADALASDSGTSALSLEDDDWDDEAPTQLGTGGVLDDDEDSALALGEDEDLKVGSGAGSDVTLGSGDSGIGLANPTDSGLSLEEEPLELGGSQVDSMSLGEDDMIELEEEGDPEAATQLKADDDFLLTPVDDDAEEESDSGSQVIALDTEQFDETADTMLAAGPAVLEEDDLGGMPSGAGLMGGPMPAGLGQPMMHPAAQLPEAKYSIWNVLSLMVVLSLMIVTGMMMSELIRNQWEFDQPGSASQPVMDFVTSLVKK